MQDFRTRRFLIKVWYKYFLNRTSFSGYLERSKVCMPFFIKYFLKCISANHYYSISSNHYCNRSRGTPIPEVEAGTWFRRSRSPFVCHTNEELMTKMKMKTMTEQKRMRHKGQRMSPQDLNQAMRVSKKKKQTGFFRSRPRFRFWVRIRLGYRFE